jgi:hypothetical protein
VYAEIYKCEIGHLPIKYLGVPLSPSLSSTSASAGKQVPSPPTTVATSLARPVRTGVSTHTLVLDNSVAHGAHKQAQINAAARATDATTT